MRNNVTYETSLSFFFEEASQIDDSGWNGQKNVKAFFVFGDSGGGSGIFLLKKTTAPDWRKTWKNTAPLEHLDGSWRKQSQTVDEFAIRILCSFLRRLQVEYWTELPNARFWQLTSITGKRETGGKGGGLR